MIQSLIVRLVEWIPTIKDLIKRLVNDPLFRFDCGFLVSDVVPSEASYSRMIDVISQSDVLNHMQDTLIQTAFIEGFICDEHLAIDATHFESRDAAKPSEKKEPTPPQKRGRKSKEEREDWLAKQAEIEANQSTYEKEIKHQLDTPLEHCGKMRPSNRIGVSKNSDGKNTFRIGFKGHLVVTIKSQYIASRLRISVG